MLNLVPFEGGGAAPKTMSSREIAELTGKQHKHVIRDIQTMLRGIRGDGPTADHQQEHGVVTEVDQRGYTSVIHLPRDLTYTLIAGYRSDLRLKIVRRWIELESASAPPVEAEPTFQVPQNFREALLLAANQQETIEHQAQHIEELEPKAEAFEALIHNGEMPSLRVFFRQFHDINLGRVQQRLCELGYLMKHPEWPGSYSIRRSHPYAPRYFRSRVTGGETWKGTTILLTPEGQERMWNLYRAGQFPLLKRFDAA